MNQKQIHLSFCRPLLLGPQLVSLIRKQKISKTTFLESCFFNWVYSIYFEQHDSVPPLA